MFTHTEDKINNTDHVWHGTATAWHTDLNSLVTPLKVSNERFSAVKIKYAKASLLAISLYLPTAGKDDDFSECLSSLSNFIKEEKNSPDSLLLGADTNCSQKSTLRRIRLFEQFCEKHDLHRVCSSSPTFHHNNMTAESNIDMFLVSEDLLGNISEVVTSCTLDNPINLSGHDLVQSSLTMYHPTRMNMEESVYANTYTEYERTRIQWDGSDIRQYQGMSDILLSKAEAFFQNSEHLPLKCKLYSKLLVKAALSTCKNKKALERTKSKPKHDYRVKAAISVYRRKFKAWNKQNRKREHPSYKEYIAARKALQSTVRYVNNLKTINLNNKIMQAGAHDRNNIYKIMKK